MGLFATMPIDEVTVQDIAASVDMTPAAVYYHFASKEQILIEGMTLFRDRLLHLVKANMPAEGDRAGVLLLVDQILGWIGKNRTYATVYYVNSAGLNTMIEALRRETRSELIDLFRTAVRPTRGRLSAAEAGVIAVGLVSLMETAIASMINQDAAYRGIGARRFAAEVSATADRIIGSRG
jgi:AcrR family transcriptional regulator